MFDKLFSKLQRVGKSFMIPIAVLPIAGLLMGIGQSLTNDSGLPSSIHAWKRNATQCTAYYYVQCWKYCL